ncbi:hypothetical protein Gotri_024690 [Gossypium trilobum]|uniref:Uncharacterized protein n=1 Tax=Gossypium trilobum TaxID=34281 RepID=A0A7J9DN90_9ROSI|nr:hypothetical protein [Gossypium trilobum]
MLCLLGGFIADTFLGRFGLFSNSNSHHHLFYFRMHHSQLTMNSLIFTDISLSQSSPQFRQLSDQFDESDPEEKSQMTNFFNWFFFFINIGSLGSVTVLVYIQDNLGREWGYGICACAIVIGLVVFLSGTKRYRFKKLVGSPLTQIAAVFVAAYKKRHLELPSNSSLLFEIDDAAEGLNNKKKKQKLPHSKQFRFLDRAAIKDPSVIKANKWNLATLTDVEEVKLVFLFVGAGEAFTYIGQLDFFLRECPKGMKTMSTGLFLSTLSLGFFLSSLLVTIVDKVTGNKHPWLPDNLNQGRLYDFYWLLAILCCLNLAIYLVFAKWYVYKDKRLADEGIELEESEPTFH